MRLKLVFELKEKYIIKDYRRKFISFFKSALGNKKEKYYNSDKATRGYTFSIYFKGIFKEEFIKIEDRKIILNFSTSDMAEGIDFTNAFINSINKVFEFGNNKITLKKVEIYNERKVIKKKTDFKILSPIIVKKRDNEEVDEKRKNRDVYYIYKDKEWVEVLKNNMKFQLQGKFDKQIDNLEIIAKEPFVKKTVVENYGIKFKVTLGRITIIGDLKLLKYFAESGIGSKRQSGFGMMEVVR